LSARERFHEICCTTLATNPGEYPNIALYGTNTLSPLDSGYNDPEADFKKIRPRYAGPYTMNEYAGVAHPYGQTIRPRGIRVTLNSEIIFDTYSIDFDEDLMVLFQTYFFYPAEDPPSWKNFMGFGGSSSPSSSNLGACHFGIDIGRDLISGDTLKFDLRCYRMLFNPIDPDWTDIECPFEIRLHSFREKVPFVYSNVEMYVEHREDAIKYNNVGTLTTDEGYQEFSTTFNI
jgi:hypothetical protein